MGFFRNLFGLKKTTKKVDLVSKKENLLITYGKAYELSIKGVPIGYYKNINQLVLQHEDKFKSKTVYYNINKTGGYKKGDYFIKELVRP